MTFSTATTGPSGVANVLLKPGQLERDADRLHDSFSIGTAMAEHQLPGDRAAFAWRGRPAGAASRVLDVLGQALDRRAPARGAPRRRAAAARRSAAWIATATGGPMVAGGPAVIGTMRSDSSSASSTLLVIMIVVTGRSVGGAQLRELLLQVAAGQRVQRAERLVQKQDLRLGAQRRGRSPRAGASRRTAGRAAGGGVAETDQLEVAAASAPAAAPASTRERGATASCTLPIADSHGSSE